MIDARNPADRGWAPPTKAFRQARERAANLVCLILIGAIGTMALPLIAGSLGVG